jgi:hypothetical protein
VRDAETGRMLPQKFDERFWAKVAVVPGDGCWEWTASRVGRNRPGGGYGQFWCSEKQTQLKAHRVAWEQANGPIPAGMLVCHRCDNPGCVRPDHLFLGTPKDNTVDMVQKGRDWKHAGARNPPEVRSWGVRIQAPRRGIWGQSEHYRAHRQAGNLEGTCAVIP